ncbi:DUF2306 domain-containing protein [Chachezhania sediminis]|uniref:DUF2306 domain-containing protein n=1 Tax=Chachezhania sediminis TaxID=2599291 RepID=UPI00131C0ACF|nr:DUF2306 domain-containing protein [Chachezhania sediminis]
MAAERQWGRIAGPVGVGLLILLPLPFVLKAAGWGWAGLGATLGAAPLAEPTHLFRTGPGPSNLASNLAMFLHMGLGAALTLLVPLQTLGAIRRRWPAVHRTIGWIVAPLALVTSVAGLSYILVRGTVGGPLMNLGFGLYGVLLAFCAVQTLRFARARDLQAHRAWAIRLILLALGSWLYRLHYTLWYIFTGGLWSAPDFSGAFDKIQLFAFYLPYLLLAQILIRRRPRSI